MTDLRSEILKHTEDFAAAAARGSLHTAAAIVPDIIQKLVTLIESVAGPTSPLAKAFPAAVKESLEDGSGKVTLQTDTSSVSVTSDGVSVVSSGTATVVANSEAPAAPPATAEPEATSDAVPEAPADETPAPAPKPKKKS